MAPKTRNPRNNGSYARVRRVAADNASLLLDRSSRSMSPSKLPWFSALSLVEDHRRWNPEVPSAGYRPTLRTVHGAPAVVDVPKTDPTRHRLGRGFSVDLAIPRILTFRNPGRVAVCVKRGRRREVMFAKKFAGRGKRIYTRPKRTWSSGISCIG